jgi:hypothetical protein
VTRSTPEPHLRLVQSAARAVGTGEDTSMSRTLRTGRQPIARYATLVALDVSGFGRRYPHPADQIGVRDRVYELFREACEMTRLPFWDSHREDRGDGLLLVAPSDTRPDLFLDPLAFHLRVLIRQTNRDLARHQPEASPLTLRVAVHQGTVYHDAHGVTSNDLILLYRLLDAAAFKRAVKQSSTELGLIISDALYQTTARTSPFVNADAYTEITITSKELRRARAWLWNT